MPRFLQGDERLNYTIAFIQNAHEITMAVDALVPNDPRVEHKFTSVRGLTYHYMLAKPEGTPVATVVLCHGWYVFPIGPP